MIWQWLKDRLTYLPEQTVIPAPVIGNDFDEVDDALSDNFLLGSPVVGREPEWDERFPKKPLISVENVVDKADTKILFDPDVRHAVEFMAAWRDASVATLRGGREIPTNVTEIRTGPSLQMQVEELRTMLRKVSKRMARLSL